MITHVKAPHETRNFDELITEEVLSKEMADFLISASNAGANILILGDTLGGMSYGQNQLLNSFSTIPSTTKKVIFNPKFLTDHPYATQMTFGRNTSSDMSYKILQEWNPSRILFDGEYVDLFEDLDFPIPKTAALSTEYFFSIRDKLADSSEFPYDLVISMQTPEPDSHIPNFRIACIYQMVKAPTTGEWTFRTLYAYRNWQPFAKVDEPTRALRRKISNALRAESLGQKNAPVDLSAQIAAAQISAAESQKTLEDCLDTLVEKLPATASEKEKEMVLYYSKALKEIISKW